MDSDDYLLLSGIQHFAFCKRQWALIHIEQLWSENYLTYSGRLMHDNADNPLFTEKRGDVLISRAVPLVSHKLRISGVADVVEYHKAETGVSIPHRRGLWQVVPVEYKHGQKKSDSCDEVQLCCQAMCLEEMLNTEILSGFLFYGKTRRRVEVVFDDELRTLTASLVSEMYALFDSGTTPSAEYSKRCESCSMMNLCLPKLFEKSSVHSYLEKFV
ncbi:MAG TPA: CRISPR-associated protein Cas4 [Methanocorpusculum sp.]|nr:CRISPR-associated protein Cas4 [Methanocorpusculum sp.]